jgi:hypothetical protein
MRRVLIALAMIGLTCAVGFAADETDKDRDITGIYQVAGTGVDGNKAYQTTATVEKNADTYLITWKFTDNSFHGVGLRDGSTLAVGWLNNGKSGVVVYHINGKQLDGKWADGSTNGKVYTETLTRQE